MSENDRNGYDNLETREADVEAPRQRIVRGGGTFESFKHRDYSLFWSGALVSNVGTWMQMYALTIVVYAFRRSEADLGIVNFVGGLPVLFLALWAGSLADRVDRRKLILWTQAVLLFQAAALGWLYVSGNLSSRDPIASLVWVASLGLVNGVMSALSFPAWQSMTPDLVPHDTLLNAIALNAAQFQSARLLGPLLAGALVLAGAGMGQIFFVNAGSFIFVIGALAVVRPRPMEPHAHHAIEGAWERLTAGLRYARENSEVGFLILTVALLTVFAMPYMTLLPAVVDKTLGFHGEAEIQRVVSWIMAANGLGAVFGALTVASLPKDVDRRRIMRSGLLVMGLMLLVFAYSRWLPLTIAVSAVAGAAFLTSTSLANTTIQSTVPNRLRGRVMSLFVLSFMGLMPISSVAFGPLAEAIRPSNAIALGAVVLLAWVARMFVRARKTA